MPSVINRPLTTLSVMSLTLFIAACGDIDVSEPADEVPITSVPVNTISQLAFRDSNAASAQISGTMALKFAAGVSSQMQDEASRAEQIWFYWADINGDTLGEPWQQTEVAELPLIQIEGDVIVPSQASMIKAYLANQLGRATEGFAVRFDDFIGNALMAGPGGNELEYWYYGDTRPKIIISKHEDTCYFDNGLVSVVDMANEKDTNWHNRPDNSEPNVADDE